jgi:peptidoglycan/LPS O-acetylase OafA/YrhL
MDKVQLSGSSAATRRIPELDGLRGVAILMVISFHYINNQLLAASQPVGKWLAFATSFGWVGVDLFFILSGFLIGTILISNSGSSNYFKTFFIRRLVRIVPNFYLLLVVWFLVASLPSIRDNYFLAGNMVIPLWSYFLLVNNIFMAVYDNLGNSALSITWSIGIEEQFYIVFPFLVFYINRKILPYILILLFVLAAIVRLQFSHWIPPYVLLPARMDGLSLGVLISYWYIQNGLEFFRRNAGYLLLVMALVIFLCGVFYRIYGDLGVFKHSLFAIFFGGCLIFALTKRESWFAYILRNKVLIWIGTISYSLYLFHYLILGLVHHIAGNTEGIGINGVPDIMLSLVAFGLSIIVAWGVFKGLEAPMVRLGKKYSY